VKKNISGCLGALGFFVVFGLIGGGLSYWGWNILQDAKASASWPTANGIVSSSDVSHTTDSDGGDTYSPEVDYQYSVDGQNYSNNTIKFGENSYSSRNKAEGIAATYPVGRQVTVYYDPNQPVKAVLEPGVSGGSYIVLGIGVLFFLIGVIVAPLTFIFRGRS